MFCIFNSMENKKVILIFESILILNDHFSWPNIKKKYLSIETVKILKLKFVIYISKNYWFFTNTSLYR